MTTTPPAPIFRAAVVREKDHGSGVYWWGHCPLCEDGDIIYGITRDECDTMRLSNFDGWVAAIQRRNRNPSARYEFAYPMFQ